MSLPGVLGELIAAASDLGFGSDGECCVGIRKDAPRIAGGQPIFIKSLALEAIDYLDEHDLLTVPALARETYDWR